MNNRSGLSLFELLVALALLAMIATGLAGALGLAVNVWDRTSSQSINAAEIALRGRLRIWLSNATPPARLTPFPSAFQGEPDRLSFVTLSETPYAPGASALRITVAVKGYRLVLSAQEIDDDGSELSAIEGDLANGITPQFSYFAANTDPPGWQDIWEDTSTLPALIRITASTDSIPDWPDFVVRPMLD